MARVVVGVDGSAASREALRVAAAEAELRGIPLLLVTAWTLPIVSTPYPIDLDPYPFERGAKHLQEGLVEQLHDSHPGVTVEGDRVCDDAREALLNRVAPDDLLVVGTKGHSRLAGLLLGSVASYCVRHAPCPVLVVPPPQEARA